ncbi:hypothetical protein IED13_00890 [Bosea sp. SSUT16]|uniref:Uncharacterized protein n=1 Tax=Bosea spartocytisi TaxID=2773451 RepID=A0A927E8J9_9HYPH|nr:hypothetical protein [Bosea spartocytisi]MBD3844234.1 hypothetical protein [Bosea spartocytisi]MCT4470658.1 hypothetical protein [Bosea spartocytisi]
MSGIRETQAPAWPRWGSLEPGKAVRRRSDIYVGCVVFIHDVNNRVYLRQHSGPDPRHFFVPREVIGETSRSWIVGWSGRGEKHPKGAPVHLFGLDDVEDALWVSEHSYRLSQHISRIRDADLLRAIAKLAGFTP